MASRVGFLLAVVPIVAVAACGTHDDSTSTVVPIEQADFATQYAHAFCDGFGGCCKSAGLTLDASACVAKVQEPMQQQVDFQTSSGRHFDAVAAARCVALVKEIVPACYASPKQILRMWSACQDIFPPDTKAAPGERCGSDSDCAPSPEGPVYCVQSSVSEDGGTVTTFQCQVLAKPYAGAPCAYFFGEPAPPMLAACANGQDPVFTCDPTTGTCVERKRVGDDCMVFADECVPSAFCNSLGKCVAREPAGSFCTPDVQSECGEYLFCDSATEICVAKRPDGSACSDNVECAGGRCAFGACNQSVETGDTSFLCRSASK
jgi:hypothetical protein